MISSVFAVTLAMAMQSDATRGAREALNACLRTYVNQSLDARMAADAFNAAYPQQCAQQETAFRAAIIARENAMRATRASAEQTARDEIEEVRTNFKERFEMAMSPN